MVYTASVFRASTSFPRSCISRSGARARLTNRSMREGIPVAPLKQTGKTRKRGTKSTFKPDTQIFTETAFSFDKLSERLREKAFLNKGIRITIKDEREEPERSHEFYYKGGIAEFVKHLNKNKSTLHDKPIYFEKEGDNLSIEVAISTTTATTRRSIRLPTTSTR